MRVAKVSNVRYGRTDTGCEDTGRYLLSYVTAHLNAHYYVRAEIAPAVCDI